MKILTKYSLRSVLKVGFLTAFLAGLMLMGIDLFKNLDTYTRYQVSGLDILILTALYFPSGTLLGLGPAFLFSVTYYLSMLHASNEYVCILNSGINYKKFLVPIIFSAVFISLFYFGFNETVALPAENLKDARMRIIASTENGSNDNSNVALNNNDNSMLVYADTYIDSSTILYGVKVLEKTANNRIAARTDARTAVWNEEKQCWILNDAYAYIPSEDGTDAKIEHLETVEKSNFNLEPELFKNLSSEISRMSLKLSKSYLSKIKQYNKIQYAVLGTSFYKRILSCLTPLVMMVIACSLSYNFKKNVLFFSLLCSICIAVVYYVIQMLTLMLANQGIIHPALGMIIPFLSVLLITFIMSFAMRG